MKKILAFLIALALMLTPAYAMTAAGHIMLADDAQTANAMWAAGKIDGITLGFGETFSFNETVGPRTQEAGFVPALNGRGVEVVGGGCAQAASALYLALCALAPGEVSFDQLSFYGDRYAGSYVANGSLAVLVDYNNDLDFRFTNLAPGTMHISMNQLTDMGMLECTVTIDTASATAAPAATEEPFFSVSEQLYVGDVSIECGSDPAVINNVTVAAGSVHDMMISSGDVFSFNDVVGPRSEDFGYVPALNGRGVVVVGGGCAQVASALWLLVRDDPDFVVESKYTYGQKYNQSYVESAEDAILVDYNNGVDFTFRYVGPDIITLYAVVQDGVLTVGRG